MADRSGPDERGGFRKAADVGIVLSRLWGIHLRWQILSLKLIQVRQVRQLHQVWTRYRVWTREVSKRLRRC